jgi:hypothetical protein
MSLGSSSLSQQAKQIAIAWQALREEWRDVKADQFEKRYLEDLPAELNRAALVMEELDNLLKRIRSDCE